MRIQRATHGRPRDGAPVVRQPRHPEVVGRPVAQRVLRRVHGQPGHRRRHRVRRRLGRQRLRPPPVGPGRRPAARAPTRSPATARSTRPRRCRTSTASPTPRARASCGSSTPRSATRCSSPASIDHFDPAPVRQRHHARPVRAAGSGAGAGDLLDVHRQLAAHRRPGPDRARPRRPAWCAALPRRRTPPTARTRFRVAIAAPAGAWAVDAARRRRTARRRSTRRGRRGAARPLRGHLGAGAARRRPRSTRSSRCCRPPTTTRCCGPAIWNTVRSAFHNAARRPGRRARPARGRRCRSRTATTRVAATRCPGSWTKVVAAQLPTRPPRLRPAARAPRWPASRPPRPAPTSQLAAFQAAISTAADAGLLRGWLAGRTLPDGHRRSTSTCAGGCWCGSPRSARSTAHELDAALDAEPTAAVPGRARPGHAPRCPTPRPRPGPGSGSPARSTCPTTSSRRPGSGMWRRGQEHLTAPYVDRYFAELPGTVAVRSGWVLADAAEHFFPITVARPRRPLARRRGADRGRATLDLSLRRRLVDAGRRAASAGSPSARGAPARPMSRPCDASGPPPGPDGPDPGRTSSSPTARAPPRGPAGHRGAAGDPAGLARRARRGGSG